MKWLLVFALILLAPIFAMMDLPVLSIPCGFLAMALPWMWMPSHSYGTSVVNHHHHYHYEQTILPVTRVIEAEEHRVERNDGTALQVRKIKQWQ